MATAQQTQAPINRETLKAAYLEWVNDYASLITYAEHKGLTLDEAGRLLALCKEVYSAAHPES